MADFSGREAYRPIGRRCASDERGGSARPPLFHNFAGTAQTARGADAVSAEVRSTFAVFGVAGRGELLAY